MGHRYEVREANGGKYKRFYVWDNDEQRVHTGGMDKFFAIRLEHQLNGRKFKAVERMEQEQKEKEEKEREAAESTSKPVVLDKEEVIENV
jgi:hypothetical protein